MKRFITLLGGAAITGSISLLSAAPLAQKPLTELLGLRKAPSAALQFGDANAARPASAPRSLAMEATEGENTAPVINASVIFPDNVQGMWSYPTTEWNPTKLASGIIATGGGVAANGYYYITRYLEAMGFEEIKTISYKLSDWSEYDIYTGQINYVATTMAYNPLRDEVYGCFINPERTGYNLVEWNYSYYQPKRTVCALERPWSGCAFSSDGTLYAIERNGDLYSVNTRTGAMTLVGSTGVESTYIGDATIDTATDTMYWSVATDTNFGLYAVDITNAKATKLYDMLNEEQLCGMYIPEAAKEIAAGAPAKISSVSTSFSGSSLTGSISFYSPYMTVGGERLDAESTLTYTVRANGIEIATGECEPNKRVTVPVTMSEPDNYYFTVTTSNEAGESAAASTRKFVGPDTPKAPTTVQATHSGNSITLQWSSPSSTGVNGGNVDYSSATYRVVRYPDMKVLAEDQTARTITDELPTPEVRTDYYYGITATVTGLSADEAKSPVVALGPITAPFEGTFKASTAVAGWTILDANADGTQWKYSSYNSALELYASKGFDDWAITPAVKVRAGTSYPFSITLKTSNYYDETFEVMWGTEPTAEAMTNTIIESTSFRSTTAQTFEGEIAAETTGTIYIGVHATTAEKSNTLDFISFTIGDGLTGTAPAAVADFTATSPVDGSRMATLSFAAPASTVNGQPLEGDLACTRIDLLRDGEVIATFTEGITPGAIITYEDASEDLTFGTHLYSAIAINANGESPVAEAQVLVGARKPVAPASALMIEEGNTGKVTISWEAVTTDAEGNSISPDAVTYRVIDRQYNTVANNVTGTSVTVTAVEEGEQAFCQFAVYAVTPGGESDKMAATAYKPVGTPYATPWAESFKNRSVSSIFGYNFIQGNEPWQFVSSHEWGIVPQDEDGGFAFLECYGDLTALVTGKINLEGLNNPAFTYYTYNYQGSFVPTNELEIQVDNGDGNGFVTVQSDRVSETGTPNQWNKVIVPLTEYDGQSVTLRIVPTKPNLAIYTLDNLRVSSNVDFNLSATRITAPNVADVDKPFEVSATVTNTGERAIQSYSVELWRNNEPVDIIECTRLEPNESKTVTFEQTVTVTDDEDAEYKAVIICDNDYNEADNTSESVTVGIVAPTVPVVTDLSAAKSANGTELTWSTPDLATAPGEPFTETFESAESWSSTVEGWKFMDQDQIPVGGTNTPGFPCTGLQSWFVVNNTLTGIQEGTDPSRWNAHSGLQYLAAEYVMRASVSYQSDDWAITPMLHGCAQALSFYAKSFDPQYLETFEVLASSTTSNIDDFVSIGTVYDVPNAWIRYRFKLPEGTKYAAIRSRSEDKYFLFIDDVTFIPYDAAPAELTLVGFNVYRNGQKLNSTPVADPSFTDATATAGRTYDYFVTAVYDKGESRRSNTVKVDPSGIGASYADGAVAITGLKGAVEVTGLTAGEVTVNTPDGRTVAQAPAAPQVRISLPAGVYIATAGAKVAKVVVK